MENKKIRKILSLILAMVLILSTTSATFAENSNKYLTVEKELESLQGKYDITIVDSSEIESNLPRLKFATVKEFEEFVNALENAENGDSAAQIIFNEAEKQGFDVSNVMAPAGVIYEDADRLQWWAPFTGWGWTGLACWKNISFNYQYEYVNSLRKLISVTNVDSYLSGITVAISWNQTNSAVNFSTARDIATFKILGYYLLGVNVAGFEIGAKINDTWYNSYFVNE